MKYFTLDELCHSNTATRLKIENKPDEESTKNLIALAENVLDPVREWLGHPITPTCAYRCPKLNAAVGGAKTSQHMKGQAADLSLGSKELNKKLFDYINKNLPYDQLINEYDYRWIHVSYSTVENRKMIVTVK
jgi:uncharacterized protein YcbK (DUF882 family)